MTTTTGFRDNTIQESIWKTQGGTYILERYDLTTTDQNPYVVFLTDTLHMTNNKLDWNQYNLHTFNNTWYYSNRTDWENKV